MATMKIEHRHSLTVEDAKSRLQALGDYLQNRHGVRVTWTGDKTASVRGKYLVVSIEGQVEILDAVIKFEGKDPGMLWRGKARSYLEGKLAQYFDAKASLDSLPRR